MFASYSFSRSTNAACDGETLGHIVLRASRISSLTPVRLQLFSSQAQSQHWLFGLLDGMLCQRRRSGVANRQQLALGRSKLHLAWQAIIICCSLIVQESSVDTTGSTFNQKPFRHG